MNSTNTFRYFCYCVAMVTMSPIVQMFYPEVPLVVNFSGIGNKANFLTLQHWCLMAFCMGLLLLWAAQQPEQRKFPLLLVSLEKLGLVFLVLFYWTSTEVKDMRMVALFDGVSAVVIILWYLQATCLKKS